MTGITAQIAAIITAIIGLAIVAVLVSNRAQTPQVIQAAGSGLGTIIGAAVAPVTGSGGNSGAPQLSNTSFLSGLGL